MKKALILSVAQTEELPVPVTIRLTVQGSAQAVVLTPRKGEEVPSDLPIRLEFLYTGALLGCLCLQVPAVPDTQSKWLGLGFPDKDSLWKDMPAAASGPRVLVTLEPLRPLSPILELTENSECSIEGSISDEVQVSILELQQERENNMEKQRDLQLKVMELKQALAKEAWRYRCTLEQMDRRYKTEIGHLVILLEKAKVAHTRDAEAIADLSARLKASDDKENARTVALEDAIKRADTAESISKDLENRLKSTLDELQAATAALQSAESQVKCQSEELQSLRCNLSSKPDKKPFKSVLQEKETQDYRQTISSLQSALSLCRAAVEDKDKELRHVTALYESLKAKSSVYESTLSSLKASVSIPEKSEHADVTTLPDLIDDMLKAYIQSHPDINVPLVRVSEGQYSVGSKKVMLTVRNGGLVIRVGGGFMVLEEFLKIYGGGEMSFIRTPRRRLARRREDGRRSQSLGLERHHRSVGTAGDITKRGSEEQENVGGTTERDEWNRDTTSPRPVYWRETVSSHNKITLKGAKSRPEERAVREGLILRDL